MIVDATNQIVGRLASNVAKALLDGEEVTIVNAEKAVVSGNPTVVKGEYRQRIERGDPYHGPFYPKQPHLILRRSIRGMIPYKSERGREAFERLRVYIGEPSEFTDKEKTSFDNASGNRITETRVTSLGDISVHLGAKKRW